MNVTSWHAAIGTSGSRHRLCAAGVDIDESMRVGKGGGVECVTLQHAVLSAGAVRVFIDLSLAAFAVTRQ